MKPALKKYLKESTSKLFLDELFITLAIAPANMRNDFIEVFYLKEHFEALHLLTQEEYEHTKQYYFNASIEEQNEIIDEYISELEATKTITKIVSYLKKDHNELFIKLLNKVKAEDSEALATITSM